MKKSRWRIQRWKHNICQKNIVIFYGSILYTAHVAMNVRGVGAGGYVRKLMIRLRHPIVHQSWTACGTCHYWTAICMILSSDVWEC